MDIFTVYSVIAIRFWSAATASFKLKPRVFFFCPWQMDLDLIWNFLSHFLGLTERIHIKQL
jgi:hypothetical protein